MAALARIGLIIVAYLISALVTGIVVYASLRMTESGASHDASNGGPGFALLITFMIVWFAACPAALTVLLGEWRGWRMWWPYSISGSLIGLVLGSLFQPPAFFPWLGLGFGVVSGAIFWAIAGRKAGQSGSRDGKIVMVVMGLIALATFLMTVPGLIGMRA